MSERAQDVLSGEELDAILAAVATSARAEEGGGGRRRPAPDLRTGALARPLRQWVEEQGRLLSTLYQRSIAFEGMGAELLPGADFAGSLIPPDRVAVVAFEPGGEVGALLVGRSLLYGWLTMALGGPRGTPVAVSERPYTPIEERFLRGIATELVERLEAALRELRPVQLRLIDLVEPQRLGTLVAPRLTVVSFDARGFGEVARLRLALPATLVEAIERRPLGAEGPPTPAVGSRLLEMPVHLHAEIGSARMSVRRVAALKAGDTIPLEPVEGGAVLLRLENRPRFRAIQGLVGNRLALELTEEVR